MRRLLWIPAICAVCVVSTFVLARAQRIAPEDRPGVLSRDSGESDEVPRARTEPGPRLQGRALPPRPAALPEPVSRAGPAQVETRLEEAPRPLPSARVDGILLDEHGRPFPEAWVASFHPGVPDWNQAVVRADGTFTIERLKWDATVTVQALLPDRYWDSPVVGPGVLKLSETPSRRHVEAGRRVVLTLERGGVLRLHVRGIPVKRGRPWLMCLKNESTGDEAFSLPARDSGRVDFYRLDPSATYQAYVLGLNCRRCVDVGGLRPSEEVQVLESVQGQDVLGRLPRASSRADAERDISIHVVDDLGCRLRVRPCSSGVYVLGLPDRPWRFVVVHGKDENGVEITSEFPAVWGGTVDVDLDPP